MGGAWVIFWSANRHGASASRNGGPGSTHDTQAPVVDTRCMWSTFYTIRRTYMVQDGTRTDDWIIRVENKNGKFVEQKRSKCKQRI